MSSGGVGANLHRQQTLNRLNSSKRLEKSPTGMSNRQSSRSLMDTPTSNIRDRLQQITARNEQQDIGDGVGAGGAAQEYLQFTHSPLDYTDDWPEVECTVHVLDCSTLDL